MNPTPAQRESESLVSETDNQLLITHEDQCSHQLEKSTVEGLPISATARPKLDRISLPDLTFHTDHLAICIYNFQFIQLICKFTKFQISGVVNLIISNTSFCMKTGLFKTEDCYV